MWKNANKRYCLIKNHILARIQDNSIALDITKELLTVFSVLQNFSLSLTFPGRMQTYPPAGTRRVRNYIPSHFRSS